MRIFPDTNVLASAIATHGLCNKLLECIITEHRLLIGEAVLPELKRILDSKFHLPPVVINDFLKLLQTEGELASAVHVPELNFEDPDDIPILACATGGKADIFVTGDKALLALGRIENIPIISPRQLWIKFEGFDISADQ